MLSDVIDVLVDPTTGSPLSITGTGSGLTGDGEKVYPIAPVGYAVFTDESSPQGDDEAMVSAREMCLSHGLFGPFVEAVTDAVHDALDDLDDEGMTSEQPIIVDLGAGTGYYLAHTLDDVASSKGIGIDISEPACTHLSGCHRRVAAVCCDATGKLPIADNSIDVVTVVFALNNPSECARILKPGGQLVTLTAVQGHLSELRTKVGIADVPGDVLSTLHNELSGRFSLVDEHTVEFPITLDHESLVTQVTMSPSAKALDPGVVMARMKDLPKSLNVTGRGVISRFAVDKG